MKILVTGGAGFIGSHIVDQYVSQGHDVVIVDNLSTGDKNQINPKAKFYVCDISSKDLQSVFEMERPEIVNHHAAQISVPYSVLHPVEDAQTNVIGMLNLLENCRRYQTRKIIFASSGGAVYGEAETVPTPETEIPRPQSPYAIHKLMGERYIDYYHSVYGLDYTVLRYANVFGPRQIPSSEAGVISKFINQLLDHVQPVLFAFEDEPQGMTRDYAFVKDIVKANVLALENASCQIVNIGTQVKTTTSALLHEIARQMKMEVEPDHQPPRPGDIRHNCLLNKQAKVLLHWEPTYSLQEGLAETIEYFRKKHKGESS